MRKMPDKYYYRNTLRIVLVYGAVTGIISGIFLYWFRIIAYWLLDKGIAIYTYIQGHLIWLPVLIIGLIGLAGLVTLFLKLEPNAGGGAIARTEGFIKGVLSFKWLKTLIATIANTFLGFFAGMPFGLEGPSIMIGTSISEGVNKISKAEPAVEKYILTSGASAGFAFATGSLVSGTIFTLEEIHKKFSLMLLFVAMSGAAFATLTVRFLDLIFSTNSSFLQLDPFQMLPLTKIWIAALVGIGAGLLATLFNYLIEKVGSFSSQTLKNVPRFYKIAFNFVFVGLIGLIVLPNLGHGHNLIVDIFNHNVVLGMLIILFFTKFISIIITATSGTTGGILVPVLVIGSLYGGLFNEIAMATGLDTIYTQAIVLIGMAAFFGTSFQVPITTIAFMIEATLNVPSTIFMIVAILFAMLIGEAFRLRPLNDIVLKRFMMEQEEGKIYHLYHIEANIHMNAFVVGKKVRDVLWPANCLIKELIQQDAHNATNMMVHGGDRVLAENDKVIFQVQSADIEKTKKDISALIGEQEYIVKNVT